MWGVAATTTSITTSSTSHNFIYQLLNISSHLLLLLMTSNQHNNTNNNGHSINSMEATYSRLLTKLKPRLLLEDSDSSSSSSSSQQQHQQHDHDADDADDDDFGHDQYWIAVAGGPGSGKSTVAHAVADRLNALKHDSAVVISMDGWHTPQKDLVQKYGEEGMKRRGAPWTFDVAALVRDIHQAKREGEASLPTYSRDISDPVIGGTLLSLNHKVVIVEGLYVLMKNDKEWGKLFHLWDETWFVECPDREEQLERLVSRSLKTWSPQKIAMWGEGEEGARKRAEFNDVPNMDIVAPCREFADEIIVTK